MPLFIQLKTYLWLVESSNWASLDGIYTLDFGVGDLIFLAILHGQNLLSHINSSKLIDCSRLHN